MPTRDRRLSIKISDEEHAQLYALAEKEGMSASDVARRLIRAAYASAFGTKKPKKR